MSVKKFVGYPDFVDDNDKLDKYYMTVSTIDNMFISLTVKNRVYLSLIKQ